jgi:hypothetical protein
VQRERELFRRVVLEENARTPKLSNELIARLTGDGPRDGGNPLSIGVVLAWGNHRLIFGGDIEIGDDETGWGGVLAILREDQQLGMLQEPRIVKMSHHGSKNAMHQGVWRLHSLKGRVPLVVVTPKRGGRNQPPQKEAMNSVHSHANELACCSEPGSGWQIFSQNLWSVRTRPHALAAGAPLQISLRPDGELGWESGEGSRVYRIAATSREKKQQGRTAAVVGKPSKGATPKRGSAARGAKGAGAGRAGARGKK